MIICISGPASTGKTTLLKTLQNESNLISSMMDVNNIEFITESIRSIIKDKYKDTDMNEILADPIESIELQMFVAESNINLFTNIFNRSNKGNSVVIMDRSPLDNLVYNMINYSSNITEYIESMYSERFRKCCSLSRYLMTNIDRVYLTQIDMNDKIEDDGFRPKQYLYRRSLESELFNSIFISDKIIKLPPRNVDRLELIITDLCKIRRS